MPKLNGDNELRFTWKTWSGIIMSMVAASSLVSAVTIGYTDLRIDAVRTESETRILILRAEFETWRSEHIRRPHDGVKDAINDIKLEIERGKR